MNNSFSYSKLINQSIVFKMIGLKKDIVIWWVTPKLGWFWNVWESPKISFSNFFHVEDDMENKDIFVSAFLSVHTWPWESNVWPLKGIPPFLYACIYQFALFFLCFFLVLICFLSVCGIALSGRFIFMYCWEFYHVWVVFHSCASQPN